jgi:predicted amidohydrolase
MLALAVITTVMMMSANHLAFASEEDDAEPKHRITLAVSNTGELVGRYAKTCLTRGDARQFQAGGFPLVHRGRKGTGMFMLTEPGRIGRFLGL